MCKVLLYPLLLRGYLYSFLYAQVFYCDNQTTITPRSKIEMPIFRITCVGCSVIFNKYLRHLLGNNAGAKPSITSINPNASSNDSAMVLLTSVMTKPAFMLALY